VPHIAIPIIAPVIPCAYLRVFRPLDTYVESERADWERYILGGGHTPSRPPVYRERPVAEGSSVGLLASAEGEYADVRLIDGRYFICPWRTRLRVLTSILSLRESASAEVAETFIPEAEARRAARELARLKRREPGAVPSMLQSPWHVPARWFVLVDDAERHLVERPDAGYRLYYWTPLQTAKRRAERALQVLRRSELSPVASLVQDLAEWLAAFHPRSFLELDYGDVSDLFSWDELDNDHSGREIQGSIEAIADPAAGGIGRAGELYQGVVARWAEAMNRESLN
jgi:hypothetical protein